MTTIKGEPVASPDFDFGSRAQQVQGAIPAVYMFQPVYRVVLAPEELGEWQRQLEEKVGIKASDISPEMRSNGTYCLCGSTYFSEACDCDQ